MSDIPKTLDEAFEALALAAGNPKTLSDFRREGPSAYHHGLGRMIRNNWGLWKKEGSLYSYLRSLGLWHADDMSGLILESFHRHLEGKPLEIEQQVRHYQDYWKEQGVEPK